MSLRILLPGKLYVAVNRRHCFVAYKSLQWLQHIHILSHSFDLTRDEPSFHSVATYGTGNLLESFAQVSNVLSMPQKRGKHGVRAIEFAPTTTSVPAIRSNIISQGLETFWLMYLCIPHSCLTKSIIHFPEGHPWAQSDFHFYCKPRVLFS